MTKGEEYKTKIELASLIIEELLEFGFKVKLVLADSLYGEAGSFIETLKKNRIEFVVAIRSNHGVLMPSYQRVRANKWCKFERKLSDRKTETRYIREIIYGKRKAITYWEMTTDPETMPENETSFVMTNIQKPRREMKKILGNLYGLRTWVEYAFREAKQELGWKDYRLTKYAEIEKWWEIVMSVYLMISLQSEVFQSLKSPESSKSSSKKGKGDITEHPQWDQKKGWKNVLNNIRLILQPALVLWWISPWLEVFPNPALLHALQDLMAMMNQVYSVPLSG